MANVIRGENTKDREWWVEKVGDDIVLKCSNSEEGWHVFIIDKWGRGKFASHIDEDDYEPRLQLDEKGRIKLVEE